MAPERIKLPTDCIVPVLRENLGKLVTLAPGAPLETITAELLVIACKQNDETSDKWQLPSAVAEFDAKRLSGALAECCTDAEFKGKLDSSTDMVRFASGPVKRCVVYGIGKGDEESIAKAASFAVSKAAGKVDSVALYIDGGAEGCVAAIAASANEAAYKDTRFKGAKKSSSDNGDKKPPSELVLVGMDPLPADALARGHAIAAGVLAAKDLVTAPANSLTPEALADAAKLVAAEAGLEIKVLGREECLELGMGLYLGVTQGSFREPRFIHMTYKPQGEVKKRVAFVGKAVTFDSGGYNLKAGANSGINYMKVDMGGSGAVFGAAATIGRIKPPGVEVHFIAPACENMVSERAIHPGDVLTGSNGKTVEVMNTDAEGRLCLADALVYAENLGEMDAIIDLATLTGAIVVALGNEVAGFWSPSDELADAVMAASKKAHEKLWRMPLVEEYGKELESDCSDLRNIGKGRGGSSITAALFLKEFVETEKWAHLDIAGPKWVEEKGGATGYGVKTLLNLAESYSK